MPAFWRVELSLFPVKNRAVSGGVLWDVCELSMTLGSLCADGWVYVPIFILLGIFLAIKGIKKRKKKD